MHKSEQEIRDYCKGHYYCDGDDLWEPFEDYSRSQIESFIRQDVESLKAFMASCKGEWDEESNKNSN